MRLAALEGAWEAFSAANPDARKTLWSASEALTQTTPWTWVTQGTKCEMLRLDPCG